MKKIVLIDGSSLLHRAFYALPIMNNAAGEYTNGVYGFVNMLNKVLVKENPDYLLVCFDKSRKTFRNNIFAEYKGTRKETPQELRGQFELIKEVLDASSISWLELADYEADDLLGTFSQKGQEDGFLVHIYTGDRDILQLISPQVKVYLTKKGISNLEEWDEEKVREHYALEPKQLIDLKALMGDASDNISGIPGVGEKTALKLMSQFSSIDELYANLEEIPKDKLKQKIAENEEVARMSYQLATICCQAPVQINWQELIYQPADNNKLLPIYQRLGFQSLLGTIKKQADQKEITKGKKSADEDAPWPTDDLNAIDNPDWAEQFPYQLLKKEQIDWFCGLAQKKGVLSLLLNWQDAYVDGNITDYALAISPEEAFLWADDRESFLVLLKQILADPGIKLITANAKEMGVLLAANGLAKVKFADDIVLAGYLLNPVLTHYEIEEIASANNIILKTYDEDGQLPYQAALCLSLAVILRENLADRDMLSLYEDVELPLSAVLGEMEASGITVDGQKLKEMSLELAKAADILAKEIQDLAGMEFNVNSPKQLADILFNKMQLPAAKKTKTGYSTNSDVLEQLAGDYPIAAKVLDYRTYAKLKSTYGDGLANLINPRTGKIHTSFKQTVTATGRLSSVEPNLQNIPVRLELGRQLRKVFLPSYSSLPSSSGNILLAGDYNQIELRILAHISGDEKLIKAFIDGEDIHTRTASEVFGLPMEEIDDNLRRQAKAVNFGIVYGISDYGLSRDLGISRWQAKDYIEKYFERYPLVEEYQKNVIEKAKKDGFVTTILGRRRYLPDLQNRNFNLRSFAERMAINTPIQGSAADIIKLAMIDIAQKMAEKDLASRMILQVHDELIFDVAAEEKDMMIALVRKSMENTMKLAVPLTVELKTGLNWYALENI